MTIADGIQSTGIFLAIIGLIITMLYNRKQLRLFNQQLKLSFFADYTKRYQEIMLNLPLNLHAVDFDFDILPDDVKDKTLRYMRSYFDLCSEEYDLWQAGYIEERIWNNWKEGIEYAFSQKAYRIAWNLIRPDKFYFPDFSVWINSVIERTKMTDAEAGEKENQPKNT